MHEKLTFSAIYTLAAVFSAILTLLAVNFSGSFLLDWYTLSLDHYILRWWISDLFFTNLICGFCFALLIGKEKLLSQSILKKSIYAAAYLVESFFVLVPMHEINKFIRTCHGNALDLSYCLTHYKIPPIYLNEYGTEVIFLAIGSIVIAFCLPPILRKLLSAKNEEN